MSELCRSATFLRWYEYNSYDQLETLHTWQTDPILNTADFTASTPSVPTGSAKTTWIYEGSTGLLKAKRYDDGKGTDYSYDAIGRLATRTWSRLDTNGSPISTSYLYNARGELTNTNYSDGVTQNVTYAYDRLGRPSVVTQGAGSTQNQHSYLYDASNLQLNSESISYASGLVRTLKRTQDSYLRSTGFELTNGTATEHATSYGYDSVGRLAGVHTGVTYPADPAQADFRYGYHANNAGLLTSVEGPVHTVINTFEDNRDLLDVKSNSTNGSDVTLISEFDYFVNEIGQRENVARSGDAFTSANTETWSYNAKGEVTSANHSTNNAFDRSYEFDGIGNRKKSADSLTLPTTDNYQANALNQYGSIDGNTRSFDEDGNLVDDGSKIYTWDAENRLIAIHQREIDGSTGAEVASYGYDFGDRRITKTVGTTETSFIYDAWNPIAVFTGTTLDKTYTWGLDLSGSMQGAGGVGGLLSVNDGSATYYPVYDGNGNVSEYVNSTGSVVAHYEYDAFGKVVGSGTKANDFAHQFSTKQLDGESSLHYYGYRYYNSSNGRWLGRDRIAERGGINLYGFVGNSSVNYWDYLGNVWGWVDSTIRGYHKFVEDGLLGLAKVDDDFNARENLDTVNLAAPATPQDLIDAKADYDHVMQTGEVSPLLLLNLPYVNKLKKCKKINDLYKKFQNKRLDPTTPKGFDDVIPGKGRGLGAKAPNRTINNKDIILREFETPKGIVDVAAEARVRGDVLKLKDIAVFPKGADKFDIGAKEVLKIRNGLADEAASQGFRRLRITGERVSGANPGKKVNVKVDLDGR